MFGIHTRFVKTAEIGDVQLRAAAEMVDETVGKKRDFTIVAKDLPRLRRCIEEHQASVAAGRRERSPLARLTDRDVDLVESAIPRLESLLHEKGDGPRQPFASAVYVNAIARESTRRCAAFVAATFGSRTTADDLDLGLGELLDARKAMADLESGVLDETDPALAAKLRSCADFDRESLEALSLFMLEGKGGLLSLGEVDIAGVHFDNAYIVYTPRDIAAGVGGDDAKRSGAGDASGAGAGRDTATAPAGEAASGVRAATAPSAEILNRTAGLTEKEATAIKLAESMMADAGFDRVYVRRSDGRILVLPHDRGGLDRIHEGFRVDLPGESFGAVVKKVDLMNSFREATVGFWGKAIETAWNGLAGKLTRRTAEKLDSTTTRVVTDFSKLGQVDPAALRDGAGAATGAVLGAAGLGMGLATLAPALLGWVSPQTIAAGTFGVGLGATLVNVIRARRADMDRTSLYNAIGVAVRTGDAVVY